jgi:hypothetical protein
VTSPIPIRFPINSRIPINRHNHRHVDRPQINQGKGLINPVPPSGKDQVGESVAVQIRHGDSHVLTRKGRSQHLLGKEEEVFIVNVIVVGIVSLVVVNVAVVARGSDSGSDSSDVRGDQTCRHRPPKQSSVKEAHPSLALVRGGLCLLAAYHPMHRSFPTTAATRNGGMLVLFEVVVELVPLKVAAGKGDLSFHIFT